MPQRPLLPLLRLGAALALGLLVLWPKSVAERAGSAPGPVPAAWTTDVNHWGSGELRAGEKATGPLPGQKRPPCVPRVEREEVGACWWPHAERPPCPPGFYEATGMCLAPVRAAQRPSTSLGE